MPFIPDSASCKVAYFTKPNPLEYPETLSVTTLAWTTSPNFAKASRSPSVVVRLLSPETKRLVEGSAGGGLFVGVDDGGMKPVRENIRLNPRVSTAVVAAATAALIAICWERTYYRNETTPK